MSNFIWCHGPHCHTKKTTDRVRGSKGAKVLRTRKIKQRTDSGWYDPNSIYNYFCGQNCIYDFWNANTQRVVALAPRNEPLETRIEDPKKETHESRYGGHTYTTTTINLKEVDTTE